MYADYTRDDVNKLLKTVTAQPQAGRVEVAKEALLDEAILNHMEHMRFRRAMTKQQAFSPRLVALPANARVHPADYR